MRIEQPADRDFPRYRFSVFELDARAGELRKQGRLVRLQGQPLQILLALLERPGIVVTRDELRQRLWRDDTFVEFDHSLNTAIKRLRETLGDTASTPTFVETVPRRGYRFVAPVERLDDPAAAAGAATNGREPRADARPAPAPAMHNGGVPQPAGVSVPPDMQAAQAAAPPQPSVASYPQDARAPIGSAAAGPSLFEIGAAQREAQAAARRQPDAAPERETRAPIGAAADPSQFELAAPQYAQQAARPPQVGVAPDEQGTHAITATPAAGTTTVTAAPGTASSGTAAQCASAAPPLEAGGSSAPPMPHSAPSASNADATPQGERVSGPPREAAAMPRGATAATAATATPPSGTAAQHASAAAPHEAGAWAAPPMLHSAPSAPNADATPLGERASGPPREAAATPRGATAATAATATPPSGTAAQHASAAPPHEADAWAAPPMLRSASSASNADATPPGERASGPPREAAAMPRGASDDDFGGKDGHHGEPPEPQWRFDRQNWTSDASASPSVPQHLATPPSTVVTRRAIVAALALAAIVAIVALALVLMPGARRVPAATPAASAAPRLAVLSFENLTGDPARAHIAEGFTEELVAQLGRLAPGRLGVIARSSSASFKTPDTPLGEIAHALNVDYLIEGSVRNDGERYRIAVRLVRARDLTAVWSEIYDGTLLDLVSMQRDVGQQVARNLTLALLPADQAALARAMTNNSRAYESYLRGLSELARGPGEGFTRAVQLFQQAIADDPRYALAHAGLAESYILQRDYYILSPDQAMPAAKAAASDALALDDGLAEAHCALADVLSRTPGESAAAEREFARALALNPSRAETQSRYAAHLSRNGRAREGRERLEQARLLAPRSADVVTEAAWMELDAGRLDAAAALANDALRYQSDFPFARYVLGQIALRRSTPREAIAQFEQARITSGHAPKYIAALVTAYLAASRRGDAARALEELRAMSRDRYVPAGTIERLSEQLNSHTPSQSGTNN